MIPSANLLAGGVQRIVDLWRVRLRESQHRYHAAVASSNNLREATRNESGRSGDVEAYYHALCHEGAARGEYMRILRIYTDLVVSGKTPAE